MCWVVVVRGGAPERCPHTGGGDNPHETPPAALVGLARNVQDAVEVALCVARGVEEEEEAQEEALTARQRPRTVRRREHDDAPDRCALVDRGLLASGAEGGGGTAAHTDAGAR